MRLMRFNTRGDLHFPVVFLIVCITVIAFFTSHSAAATRAKQKTFASPEEAVKAVVDALRNNDTKELNAILGPGAKSLVSSGDEVADRAGRERFVKNFETMHRLEQDSTGKMILHVGSDDYPMPIPIVKRGKQWFLDTQAGKEELINRRIGRNELNVIDALHAFVDAQREYAVKDLDGDGTMAFAQKFMSSKDKHDGLYWEVKEGQEESPLGPLVARASAVGYETKGRSEKPSPFHGYYFRILKAQGPHATGGAYDYVVNGKMILGFAFLAYPANYGSSGIMTFIVNQDGVVYQKNLGKNTVKTAKAMMTYDPDKTWKKAEEIKTKEQGTTTESTGEGTSREGTKEDPKKEEKRRAILGMRDRTLAQLYETNPEAKAEVESAVGYAVFDVTGINVILVVGVKGKGVAVENGSNKVTYTNMVRAGTGPGIGYKDYRIVLVFKNKSVFDRFITLGMDAGASADATMKLGGQGKEAAYASSFNPYVKVYQITDKGLLLQANWGGTKFLKDSELNE